MDMNAGARMQPQQTSYNYGINRARAASSQPETMEQRRVGLILEINTELLRHAIKVTNEGKSTDDPTYVSCMRRLQCNLQYLYGLVDPSKKSNAPGSQFPQILVAPPEVPELTESYQRLQQMFPEVVQFLRQQQSQQVQRQSQTPQPQPQPPQAQSQPQPQPQQPQPQPQNQPQMFQQQSQLQHQQQQQQQPQQQHAMAHGQPQFQPQLAQQNGQGMPMGQPQMQQQTPQPPQQQPQMGGFYMP